MNSKDMITDAYQRAKGTWERLETERAQLVDGEYISDLEFATHPMHRYTLHNAASTMLSTRDMGNIPYPASQQVLTWSEELGDWQPRIEVTTFGSTGREFI